MGDLGDGAVVEGASPHVDLDFVHTLAAEVVKRAGYVQVALPWAEGLALMRGAQLLLLLPKGEVSKAQASADLARWRSRLKDGDLPGITSVHVLYSSPNEILIPKAVRWLRRAAWRGSCYSGVVGRDGLGAGDCVVWIE